MLLRGPLSNILAEREFLVKIFLSPRAPNGNSVLLRGRASFGKIIAVYEDFQRLFCLFLLSLSIFHLERVETATDYGCRWIVATGMMSNNQNFGGFFLLLFFLWRVFGKNHSSVVNATRFLDPYAFFRLGSIER